MRSSFLALVFVVLLASPAAAQLVGNDTAPGDSCAGKPAGATRMTADPDQDGAEVVLICDGSIWRAASEPAATPERGIQFNSGGGLTADSIFTYTSAGNVGIGTDKPTANIHVVVPPDENYIPRIRIETRDDTYNNATLSLNTGDDDWNIAAESASGGNGGSESNLYINYGGTGLITLDPNGKMLLGGSNDVVGSGSIVKVDGNVTIGNGWVQYGSSYPAPTNGLLVQGDVGIGTNSPDAKLDVAGEVKIGNSGLACSSSGEGTMRYTGGDPPWEYCDGSDWVNFKQPRCEDDDTGECYLQAARDDDDPDFTAANIADGVEILGVTGTLSAGGGCEAPTLCPNIGDLCDDGNGGNNPDPIFAGFMAYNDPNSADEGGCKPLYVSNDNQSTSSQLRSSGSGNSISTDSTEDGLVNRDNLDGGGTFPAFDECDSLSDGGFNDWYLPARDELHLLWKNRDAINNNAAGDFTTSGYWSSTEYNSDYGWGQFFSNGDQLDVSNASKTDYHDVRCVRRD